MSSPDQSSAGNAEAKHDHRVYFACECCEEYEPENSVSCRSDIAVMPDGTWLCDNCYSECDKTAYGMAASDVDDFEFPRFEDLPRPAPYAAQPQAARMRRGSMAAQWTYDAEAEAYYFAPLHAAPPPYLTQRHVEAILDIASDGTLAGVELIDKVPPPPTAALSRPK